MSRRGALIGLAIATAALGAFQLAVDPANEADGNPTIVDFEFAWDEDGAREILDDWGEEGQDAARLSLWVDFVYLLAYGAFLTLAAMVTRERAAKRGSRRLAAAGAIAVPAAIVAPVFDAIEDVFLLITLGGDGGDAAPLVAAISACVKFAALAVAIAYVLAGLVLLVSERRSRA